MKVIPLTQNKIALIDDEDYKRVCIYNWYSVTEGRISKVVYAARSVLVNGKRRAQKMQRYIIGEIPGGMIVDHINGNGIDNRRINLRVATKQQNLQNTIGRGDRKCKYKGVSIRSDGKKFIAQVGHGNSRKYLGSFETQEDAALAYNIAAKELFGDYARLNIIKNE